MKQQELIELYSKFPVFLRNKLTTKEIEFPTGTRFEYESFTAFRGIFREPEDNTPLNIEDMRSYYELGKRPRGMRNDDNDAGLYSVSLYRSYDDIAMAFYFPKPGKKLAQGKVFPEGGPQYSAVETSHVDWWLYEDADFSSYEIREDLNEQRNMLLY